MPQNLFCFLKLPMRNEEHTLQCSPPLICLVTVYRGTDARVYLLSSWEFTANWDAVALRPPTTPNYFMTQWNEPEMTEEKCIALRDSGEDFILEPGRDFVINEAYIKDLPESHDIVIFPRL